MTYDKRWGDANPFPTDVLKNVGECHVLRTDAIFHTAAKAFDLNRIGKRVADVFARCEGSPNKPEAWHMHERARVTEMHTHTHTHTHTTTMHVCASVCARVCV